MSSATSSNNRCAIAIACSRAAAVRVTNGRRWLLTRDAFHFSIAGNVLEWPLPMCNKASPAGGRAGRPGRHRNLRNGRMKKWTINQKRGSAPNAGDQGGL
jgi:hypothetical protein